MKKTQYLKVINESRDELFLQQVEVADRFFLRLKGLAGRKHLPREAGMLIIPCRSIHTLGMKFALDVIFLDKNNRVCRVVPEVLPGKFISGGSGACCVLEVPAGILSYKKVVEGDYMGFKHKEID